MKQFTPRVEKDIPAELSKQIEQILTEQQEKLENYLAVKRAYDAKKKELDELDITLSLAYANVADVEQELTTIFEQIAIKSNRRKLVGGKVKITERSTLIVKDAEKAKVWALANYPNAKTFDLKEHKDALLELAVELMPDIFSIDWKKIEQAERKKIVDTRETITDADLDDYRGLGRSYRSDLPVDFDFQMLVSFDFEDLVTSYLHNKDILNATIDDTE